MPFCVWWTAGFTCGDRTAFPGKIIAAADQGDGHEKGARKGMCEMKDKIFSVLQRVGRSFMLPIAILPVAGLLLGIGSSFTNATTIATYGLEAFLGDGTLLHSLLTIMSKAGSVIFDNLPIIFAVGVAIGMAKAEKEVAALSAMIAFLVMNISINAVLQNTGKVLADGSVAEGVLEGTITSVLGIQTLQMGVFGGIIVGLGVAALHNRYHKIVLPNALSFFGGSRFVPIISTITYVFVGILMYFVWPVVQTGLNSFGVWIANSSATSPILAPFIYGTLERLLLPFGLHHMLTIPMNYTSFGGTYTILTGVNAGSQVFGQDPLWLAWATDLINLQNAGDITGYQNLLTAITPARFKVGQMIGATGLLLGIALAMYRRVDADKRSSYRSMFISTVLAVFLTGVTEPLEFMFMFCALPLYLVYAVLQGCAFAMAGIIHLRLHSFGNLEFLTRIPMSLKAGLGGDIINFIICVAVFFAVGYAIAYFMIGRFHFATPGRLGNYTDDNGDGDGQNGPEKQISGNRQAERIITLLGGRDNILLVDACMTRLRVTVKDITKVAELADWKAEGAMGLIKKDQGIQAVYGPKADVLKSDINDIL